jgi:hypothetical protein
MASRYYPCIFLQGLRKTTKTSIRIGDAPPEYKSEAFALNQSVLYDYVIVVFVCIGDSLVTTVNTLLCSAPYLDVQRPAFTRHIIVLVPYVYLIVNQIFSPLYKKRFAYGPWLGIQYYRNLGPCFRWNY